MRQHRPEAQLVGTPIAGMTSERGKVLRGNLMRDRRISLFLLAALAINCRQAASAPSAQQGPAQVKEPSPTKLLSLHPDGTAAGKAFNVQKSGNAGLAVKTSGATPTTVIIFGGEGLVTVFGGHSLLTAEVPRRLYAKPGRYEVYLQDLGKRSNTLMFEVR